MAKRQVMDLMGRTRAVRPFSIGSVRVQYNYVYTFLHN